jgi:acetyl esterase/lipase
VARAARVPVLVPDYRPAPEHSFPDAPPADATRAWEWLHDNSFAASRIGLVGDSAGGALVTLLALALRDRGEELPGAVVSLSPMYDLEATGESFDTNAGHDLTPRGRRPARPRRCSSATGRRWTRR